MNNLKGHEVPFQYRQNPINVWGSLQNSFSFSSELYNMPIIFVPQVEVIGGADKYQAVCRKCYGGLMVDKENRFRDETPPHDHSEKLKDSAVSRTPFSTLYLWKDSSICGLILLLFVYWFLIGIHLIRNLSIPENESINNNAVGLITYCIKQP